MYKIIGYQTDYTANPYGDTISYDTEEVVATFDTEQEAINYIEASRLKTPRPRSWNDGRPFRANSLLSPYASVEITTDLPSKIPPHNPVL